MHLRDAKNLFDTLGSLDETQRPDLLAKPCILFAAAGLETNLSYFSTLAIGLHQAAPAPIYKDPELEYLKAVQAEYSKSGELVEKKQKQCLDERIKIVPGLLGRAFGQKFEYESALSESERERLRNTIARRDAIIHPTWDKYPDVGLAEARDALYSVIRYIDAVRLRFFPFMVSVRGTPLCSDSTPHSSLVE